MPRNRSQTPHQASRRQHLRPNATVIGVSLSVTWYVPHRSHRRALSASLSREPPALHIPLANTHRMRARTLKLRRAVIRRGLPFSRVCWCVRLSACDRVNACLFVFRRLESAEASVLPLLPLSLLSGGAFEPRPCGSARELNTSLGSHQLAIPMAPKAIGGKGFWRQNLLTPKALGTNGLQRHAASLTLGLVVACFLGGKLYHYIVPIVTDRQRERER